MTDDRDSLLKMLFAEARRDLDGEVFLVSVMTQTRNRRYRLFAALFAVTLMFATFAWFLDIPIQLAELITQALSIALIDLGDSWLAWLFSPVNNLAGLIVLVVKTVRVYRKKVMRVSYAI